jgi:hypothetical protein
MTHVRSEDSSEDLKADEKAPSILDNLASAEKSKKDGEQQIEYPTGWKLWTILVGITVACMLVGLDTSIIGTVSPHSQVPRYTKTML